MLGNHGRSITRAIFTPVAKLLVKLHVTPNMVTVTGTVLTVAIAVGLLARGEVVWATVGLLVVLFADSLDGVLARLTGQTSVFGGFLDSTLDRISDGAVFGSLLFWVATSFDPGAVRTTAVIAGIACMTLVGTVPYARARAESFGVVAKVGIAERTDRLIIAMLCALGTALGLPEWVMAVGLGCVALASFITVIQRMVFTKKALAAREADEVRDGNADGAATGEAR